MIKKKASGKLRQTERNPQKRRALTEEKLLKAGIKVFSKNGYDGATTREISKKAGVNESLIIRYFGSKEGLYLEAIRRFIESKRTGPLPYPLQVNLEEELICHVRGVLENLEKNRDLYKILLSPSTIDGKMRKKINEIIPKQGDPRVLDRLEKLRTKSKLPANVPTDLLLLAPFQALSAMYLATTVFDLEPKPFAEAMETLVRAVVRGLQVTEE